MNSSNDKRLYRDVYYDSTDGLKLYARDYPCTGNRQTETTILCIHGLTRNSADFNFTCQRLNKNYRLIAVDLRGRGLSAYDPKPENYQPGFYIQDMFNLIEQLGLTQLILLGTSLGGLMSIIMGAMRPDLFNAIILNDVGPEVNSSGLSRIQSYVGKQNPVDSWDEAIAQAKSTNSEALPNMDEASWLNFTHGVYRENSEGKPQLAYDPKIAVPIEKSTDTAVPPDLWPQFRLLKGKPLLLIRGENSDILSYENANKMQEINSQMQYCEVANRGHAPLLNEAECMQAIDEFLQAL